MGMKQKEINALRCKRLAGDNHTCLSILLQLIDLGRSDILDAIEESNKNYHDITADSIVALYNKVGSIDKFIAKYDKTRKDASYVRSHYYRYLEKDLESYKD